LFYIIEKIEQNEMNAPDTHIEVLNKTANDCVAVTKKKDKRRPE